MSSLGRFIFYSIILAAIVWIAVTVPVGKYTIWQHIVRISHTDEAKELKEGAKQSARDAARRVKEELNNSDLVPKTSPSAPAAPAK